MEGKKKSKLRMAWNQYKRLDSRYGMIVVGVLLVTFAVFLIIRSHIYREPLFYVAVVTIVGWRFLLPFIAKSKTRFNSKRAEIVDALVRGLLVFFLPFMGSWFFFSFILSRRLGGEDGERAPLALLLTFCSIVVIWHPVQMVPDLIRRSKHRGKKDMLG
jgi:hypothetical protein